MLEINNKVALVVCSNGKAREDKIKLDKLEEILKSLGLVPVYSNYLYKDKFGRSASAEIRSEELMNFFNDKSIKALFDISGGDIANEILEYLDYDVIKENYKPFFGYSDLTTVLNALVSKIDKINYLYQLLNIIENENIRISFENTFLKKKNSLFDVNWRFLQGTKIEGELVGGNIRCFLKLAGTEYFPKVENKVLFIEGLGTSIEGLLTHLAQLKQLGVFDKISGLLIGTFTKIEKEFSVDEIFKIVKSYVPSSLPIVKTQEVGHAKDSKALKLGEKINIKNELIV